MHLRKCLPACTFSFFHIIQPNTIVNNVNNYVKNFKDKHFTCFGIKEACKQAVLLHS